MRKISFYLLTAILLIGVLFLLNNQDYFSGVIKQYVENGEFTTLEVRYSPEQIMETHREELLGDELHTFQAPSLRFQPYSLLEVKYIQADKKSREGLIFWSLIDGEMVLNTETWEKTHGFEDAINAGATQTDFKLLNALAKSKGASSIDKLQKELHIEKETLQPWIESALSKHLIIQRGNELQLHFQDPKILVQPETKISHRLVSKPYNYDQLISKKYSTNQIHKIAQAAFGYGFTIRSTREVFLPIYNIEVLNPADGSIHTSQWNALTGQRIFFKYGL